MMAFITFFIKWAKMGFPVGRNSYLPWDQELQFSSDEYPYVIRFTRRIGRGLEYFGPDESIPPVVVDVVSAK